MSEWGASYALSKATLTPLGPRSILSLLGMSYPSIVLAFESHIENKNGISPDDHILFNENP